MGTGVWRKNIADYSKGAIEVQEFLNTLGGVPEFTDVRSGRFPRRHERANPPPRRPPGEWPLALPGPAQRRCVRSPPGPGDCTGTRRAAYRRVCRAPPREGLAPPRPAKRARPCGARQEWLLEVALRRQVRRGVRSRLDPPVVRGSAAP